MISFKIGLLLYAVGPLKHASRECWLFDTASHPEITYYGNLFYKNQIKIIPCNLEDLLTARGLAYWFMDDGSLKSKESKGVIFNTHSFELKDIEFLCSILSSKFNLKAWPRKQKGKDKILYQIYISGKSYETLKELIYPFLIPEMLYKFPPERKTRNNKIKKG